MTRLQLAGLLLLSIVACDDRSSTTASNPPIPTAPTVAGPTALELSGKVVEIGAGPVADAAVTARSCASSANVLGQTLTDASGAFRLAVDTGAHLPIGYVCLTAEKSGYERATEEPIGGPASSENITVRIQRLRRAAGTVIEVDGGSPVPGVNISTGASTPAATTFSDATGAFVLNGVGKFFTLGKSGFVGRTMEVPEGQDVDLGQVRLQRTMEIATGARLTSQISSMDVSYDDFFVMWDDGVFCSPCKSIDLQTLQQDVEIQLEWSGEVPLALWAAGPAYEESRSRGAPGVSSLSLRAPRTTSVLLVGVPTPMPGQQTLAQPVRFELTATALPR